MAQILASSSGELIECSATNGTGVVMDSEVLKTVLWFCTLYQTEKNVNSEIQLDDLTKDDAAWILGNAFLILTMQTGFGMLEAGSVSPKNVANIMIKNVIDASIGGLAYWTVGYGLSFGDGNAFVGFGKFFVTALDSDTMAPVYAHYIFQFSFATAATTIVSGAVAERIKLEAYMIYSFLNVFIYCLPARWVWSKGGWLGDMGFYDFAGATIVHLSGGSGALVAAYMLGPRKGRFEGKEDFGMSSPVTALTGTFMLWWAWLAFNCGSTFGISGNRWKTATKVAVNTINGSIGGSLAGIVMSVVLTWKGGHYFDIPIIICSILAGLVSITCGCSVFTPGESIIIGAIGAVLAVAVMHLMEKVEVDDPVSAIPVHCASAVWSTLAVGIFAQNEFGILSHPDAQFGVLHGGSGYLFLIQLMGAAVVAVWSMLTTWLAFFLIDITIGIRMDAEDEEQGADWVEHRVKSESFADRMEKAIERIHKEGLDFENDGHIVVQMMGELMKTASVQKAAETFKTNKSTVEAIAEATVPNLVRKAIKKRQSSRSGIQPLYVDDLSL